MAAMNIDGFFQDYRDLVDPDYHDPSTEALIDMVLMAAEAASPGEPFSIWVDGECTQDHEAKEFAFNFDNEDRQIAIKYVGVK